MELVFMIFKGNVVFQIVKENYIQIVVKWLRDFIWDSCNRENRIQYINGFNFYYNKDKWKFIFNN